MTRDGRTRLVVASANPHKVVEIEEILRGELGATLELVPRPAEVPDVEETADTLEGNARLKAVALQAATGLGALADDSGLEVDALAGAPGVHSARYAGPGATAVDNLEKLLGALETSGALDARARTARFRTVALARLADGRELASEGVVEGLIVARARGAGGFGYDPVFEPNEAPGRTFAELDPGEKHAISARGRAFRGLALMLRREIDKARPTDDR